MNTIIECLYLIAKFILGLVPTITEIEEYINYSLISTVTGLNINTISTSSRILTIVINSGIALLIANRINKFIFNIIDKRNRRA